MHQHYWDLKSSKSLRAALKADQKVNHLISHDSSEVSHWDYYDLCVNAFKNSKTKCEAVMRRVSWLKRIPKAGICRANQTAELLFVAGWETLKNRRCSVWGDEGLTILQADFNTAAKRWLLPFSHSAVQL